MLSINVRGWVFRPEVKMESSQPIIDVDYGVYILFCRIKGRPLTTIMHYF